jgi:hypothetical protein
LLDGLKHRILLRLVEPVDLVDEEDGALAGASSITLRRSATPAVTAETPKKRA